jgi:hypothetical protein
MSISVHHTVQSSGYYRTIDYVHSMSTEERNELLKSVPLTRSPVRPVVCEVQESHMDEAYFLKRLKVKRLKVK